jgi:hypothetical protein
MHCLLCESRPARRACPGVRQDICAVCCGTKRLTEIRCPDTCAYLANARVHPAAITRKQQDRDIGALVPALQVLSEPQQQLLLLTLTLVDRFKGEGFDEVLDKDVSAAISSLAATYETEAKGLIYEHRADSMPAERLAREIRTVYDEVGKSRPSAFAVYASVMLRQLERRIGEVARSSGNDPRAFVELAGRVARRFHEGGEPPGATGESSPAPSPLIIP